MEGDSWIENHKREDHGCIWEASGCNSGRRLEGIDKHLGGWRQLRDLELEGILEASGESLEFWKLSRAAGSYRLVPTRFERKMCKLHCFLLSKMVRPTIIVERKECNMHGVL